MGATNRYAMQFGRSLAIQNHPAASKFGGREGWRTKVKDYRVIHEIDKQHVPLK